MNAVVSSGRGIVPRSCSDRRRKRRRSSARCTFGADRLYISSNWWVARIEPGNTRLKIARTMPNRILRGGANRYESLTIFDQTVFSTPQRDENPFNPASSHFNLLADVNKSALSYMARTTRFFRTNNSWFFMVSRPSCARQRGKITSAPLCRCILTCGCF
jgi:hypothetical protein